MDKRVKPLPAFVAPLMILAGLLIAIGWGSVRTTIEQWLSSFVFHLPAGIQPGHAMVAATLIGILIVVMLLWRLTRRLQRHLNHRRRDQLIESKRKQGHSRIAANVFDGKSIELLVESERTRSGLTGSRRSAARR